MGNPVKRSALLFLLTPLPAGAGVLALAACSSSTETKTPQAAEDAAAEVLVQAPVEPVDAAPPACTLTKDMKTGVKACDDCLQASCCLSIVSCLGETTCAALNDCLNDCRTQFGSTSDAGAQCVRACAKDKEEPAKRLTDLLECESTRCGTACK